MKTNAILLKRSNELLDLNDEFKKLSVTDSLTGLFNRRYFEETLENEIEIINRHGDVNSLLVIDIDHDHFKKVNDQYGHMHSDTVIKMISDVMKGRLREIDVLCRIGGEEFVAICRGADKASAISLAEDIRTSVEKKTILAGKDEISVTISIGIITIDKENIGLYAENIFKYAGIALYYSKEHGRNKVSHYSDIV